MTDYNQLTNRAEAFDAYVQFTVAGTPDRLKSLASVTTRFNWSDERRYDDAGNLYLVRNGQGHTCSMSLALTSDLTDPNSPPSDGKTLSSMIYAKEVLGARVQINVIQVFLSKAGSTPNARLSFTLDVQSISFNRGPGGVVNIELSGTILNSGGVSMISSTSPMTQWQTSGTANPTTIGDLAS